MLNAVLWPEATIDHPPFKGGPAEFCAAALEFISLVDVSMHFISNISIQFDGDTAYTESYFTGYHLEGLAA